jgi:multiple sugar transport system permease protein
MVVSKKEKLFKVILTVIFLIIGFTMLLPLLWMISTSLKFEVDVFKFPIQWIPERFNALSNYKTVWGPEYQFGLFYLNSIKVAIYATVFQVFVSAMGAYGFSKIQWPGRDKLFLVYIACLMIPNQITIISRFIILKEMGLYNTHLGLILTLVFSVYGVFLLKQSMMSVPDSICESAKIDGAGHARVFMQIMMPMSKPALATLAILKFTMTWNDYQSPLVLLNSRDLFTIQLGMKMFASEAGNYYSLIMAAAVSAIVPLIIVFLVFQKQVVEGIATGAVKG